MRLEFREHISGAYTRVDLIIALTTIVLLATVGFSVLGNTAVRSDVIVCANNLRQVGRAFNMWASDHGGENPWWVSYAEGGGYIRFNEPTPASINVPGGGPLPSALRNNPWFHFGFISQELRTPQVLVCPADRPKTRAQEFSNNSSQGYFSPNFQNHATSYFIGAHAVSLFPSAMLSGDRSLKEDAFAASCVVNVGGLSRIDMDGSPPGWTSDLHPGGGNILANDGRVEELSPGGLSKFLVPAVGDDLTSTHLLKPN